MSLTPQGSRIGRADLIRLLRLARPGDSTDWITALSGFVAGQPAVDRTAEPAPRKRPAAPTNVRMEPVLEPAPDERKVRFLQPVRYWRIEPEVAPPRPSRQALRTRDLAVPIDRPEPLVPPLQPWSRFWPYLRRTLGERRAGHAVDVPRFVREFARVRPITRVPRRRWPEWASSAVVVLDRSLALAPFWRDMDTLIDRLACVLGPASLDCRWSDGPPAPETRLADLRPVESATGRMITPSAPVLLVSDLGRLARDAERTAAWSRFGRELRSHGHRVAAISLCPRDRWDAEQARVWPSGCWDRGEALPRTSTGHRPLVAVSGRNEARGTETLLDLLSPSVRIEPGLLRLVRLTLPPTLVNVGSEFDAWHHPHMARTPLAIGFRPDVAPMRRAAFPTHAATWQADAARWILMWHELCSPLLAAEAKANLGAIGVGVTREETSAARRYLVRAVDTMEGIARDRNRVVAREIGLFAYYAGMVKRLASGERGTGLVSRGYAYWLHLEGATTAERPAGIDGAIVDRELNALIAEPGQETRWLVRQSGSDVFWVRSSAADSELVAASGVRIAEIAARRPRLVVRREAETGPSRIRELLPAQADDWRVSLGDEDTITVTSDCAETALVSQPRPSWASRMGCDRFGLYADLELAVRVMLRLRWIPPGTFRMGSPEDEAWRDEREGPQHEVTISNGFWLAETPVTQAQWLAAKVGDPGFSEKFDTASFPQSEVSWHQSRGFCAELAERFPELVFDLPTEAEWEYACRAGTTSAFNDGSACTAPVREDPALDRLGWYDKNSEGTMHPVGAKAGNAWGLRDMHGNVLEWCLDGPREYRNAAETDPVGPPDGDERVVRGGSWKNHARFCRSGNRFRPRRNEFNPEYGFRLAAGQELQHEARGTAAKATRDAAPKGRPVHGVRRPRPWAQNFARDAYGVRLEFNVRGVRFLWRWIPRGRFAMGSPKDEAGRWKDEGPQHEVTLSHGFWLGSTPLTQAQWQAVVGKNPSNFKGGDRPVESVRWEDCQEYCAALNRLLPGLDARLPTEAQWEYACRAGTAGAFNDGSACTAPNGDDPGLNRLGWYDKNANGETPPVAGKLPNAWGLHDMHGNVWEWCYDWFGPYARDAQTDPTGPETGGNRVVRGGSWFNPAWNCRSVYRDRNHPGNRNDNLGFRLAAGQPPEVFERSESREAEGADAPGPRDEASAPRRKLSLRKRMLRGVLWQGDIELNA